MPQLFICWVENHLCSFHFEVTINSSAMNIHFPVFEWKCMQIYLEYLSRRGIFVSYGRNMFYLLHVCSVAQLYLTLCDPYGLQPIKFLCPWDFPGKNTGLGCHILLLEPPGIKPVTPSLAGRFLSTMSPWKPILFIRNF